MRKIEIRKVGDFQKIFLNNEQLKFQAGPLDQGYWPDGILTPPTEAALKWDLDTTLAMGFNMIRKHIKIGINNKFILTFIFLLCFSLNSVGKYFLFAESSRWYYWTDKMGILVWQDFPCISDKATITEKDKMNFQQEYTR